MKKWFIIFVTVCIVISLSIFVQTTDFSQVFKSIQQVGFKFGWLLLVTGLAYLFATISWRYCLGDRYRSVSIIKLFLIRHVGETVTLFNPASVIGGDTVKALMLEKHGIDQKRVVASVLLSRLLLIVSQLSLFTIALGILYIPALLLKVSATTAFSSAFSFASVKSLNLRSKSQTIRAKIHILIGEITPLLKENKRMLFIAIGFAILHWVFGSFEFYFILKFLGLDVSIFQALLIDLGVVFFKTAGAFIPGQLGIEEYGNKIMLALIGITSAEIWITASILRRARQLVWIAFGILAYFLLFKHTAKPKQNE